jgi:hypothetical protein
MDVSADDTARIADEDLALAIDDEKKYMEGMTKSDARAWVDKKTRSLQRSILALTAIRNTLVAIDNFPDEILVEIFWLLALSVRPDLVPVGDIRPKTGISWLAVSKVCRRWRNIALWTPKLYSFVDGRDITITRVFLRRSSNVPVDVHLQSDAKSGPQDETMSVIKPHFFRVRELHCRLRFQILLSVLAHLSSVPAPVLESLHLKQSSVRRILGLNETIVIPEIFNGKTPALRRLHLANVSIPWTSPIYTGLTDLHLHLQHPSAAPPIDTFLRVLENCPLLETLTLVRAGPCLEADLPEYPSPARVVELARLREIYLHPNRPIDAQYVVAHLDIPSTATIIICCKLDSNQDFSSVLPRDCGSLRGFSRIRHLRLYVEDVQSISLIGYAQSSAKVLFLSLYVGENEGMLKPRLFVSQLDRFFPLSHLENLELVDCAAHLSSEKLIEVLSKLPSLTQLTACEKWPARQRQILKALVMPSLDNSESVVCPSLKVIRFSGLDCKEEVIEDVAETCRYRGHKGAPLDAVHIAGLGAVGVMSLLRVDVVVDVNARWVDEVGYICHIH